MDGATCSALFVGTEQIADAISKLKTLKSVWLFRFKHLTLSHNFGICKHLVELSELKLQFNEFKMSADDILEIVKSAPKLHLLQYFENKDIYYGQKEWSCENASCRLFVVGRMISRSKIMMPSHCTDVYKKIVQLFEQRRKKTRLLIKVKFYHPLVNHVPKDLIRKNNDTLAIEAVDKAHFERFPFHHIEV